MRNRIITGVTGSHGDSATPTCLSPYAPCPLVCRQPKSQGENPNCSHLQCAFSIHPLTDWCKPAASGADSHMIFRPVAQ